MSFKPIERISRFARPVVRARRRGASIVWVVSTVTLLITLTGVCVDSAHLFFSSHQIQNVADAAALAGARSVRESAIDAQEAAIAVAVANRAVGDEVQLVPNPQNDPAGDIVIGRYNRETSVFTPTTSAANAVMVRVRRTADSPNGRVPLRFGAALGINGVDVTRTAIAMNSGGTGAGLIALAPDGCGLDMGGNVKLHVNDGDIQINSGSNCAVCTNGGPVINTGQINVLGNACLSGQTTFNGIVNPGAPPIPDPLAYLPPPPIPAPQNPPGVFVQNGQTVELSGGYYPNGIRMTGGTLNLQPGIYIVGSGGGGGQYPPGLSINGGNFNAEGVMIYVLSGAVDIGGNGTVNLTPPNPELHNFPGATTYENVSIFQARDNTRQARIIGTSSMNLGGSLYFPRNRINLAGTSEGVGDQLIADRVGMSGTGDITINYTGNFNAAGSSVFLVR